MVLFGYAWNFDELWFRIHGAATLHSSSFGLTLVLIVPAAAVASTVCFAAGNEVCCAVKVLQLAWDKTQHGVD